MSKWTLQKYILKGFALNIGMTLSIYVYSFFGTTLPYVVESLFGFAYDSDEYDTLYNVSYVLFCLTVVIGGLVGGPFLRERKRLLPLIAADLMMALSSILYFFPFYYTFILARFIEGFLVGFIISVNSLLNSELNLPAISGIFLTIPVACMVSGSICSSIVSYFVELEWGWTFAICLIMFLSFLHIVVLLVFFRKETPIFHLLVYNSEEASKDSLHFLLNDSETETIVYQGLLDEKEVRKKEPRIKEILANKTMLKRNLKGLLFNSFFESLGTSFVVGNWTEIGYLFLGSTFDDFSSKDVKIFVTCMVFIRFFAVNISGVILNFVRRTIYFKIICPFFIVCAFCVYFGTTLFDWAVFLPGLFCLVSMVFLTNGSNVVGGEMSERMVYSISVGLLRVISFFQSIIYSLFGIEFLFLTFGIFALVDWVLYFTIYNETFRKSLADIEREEKEQEYKSI